MNYNYKTEILDSYIDYSKQFNKYNQIMDINNFAHKIYISYKVYTIEQLVYLIKNKYILVTRDKNKTIFKYSDSLSFPQNKNYKITYDNKDFIIVNKPENLTMHPTGKHTNSTLIQLLKQKYNTNGLYLVNRLDNITKGLVIIAKNKNTLNKFKDLFKNKKIIKEYYAICKNKIIKTDELSINTKILNKPTNKLFKNLIIDQEGKRASTKLKVINRYRIKKEFKNKFNYNQFTLINLKPITGRQHQLRLHTASLNYGIVGDPRYGNKDQNNSQLFFLNYVKSIYTKSMYKEMCSTSLMLQCYKLQFKLGKKEYKFEIKLDKTLKDFIDKLEIRK